MLAEKISGTQNFFFCRLPKTIANNRRRLTRGGRTGFAARRKFGTHLPPQVGKRRIPATFSPGIFPLPVLGQSLRCLFLSKCCMWKSCRKTGFDFFLTIVLTGSGRLPSGRSYPLATRREGRSSTEVGLPPMAMQFCFPPVSFCSSKPKPQATKKRRFACLAQSSPTPFPTEARRLPVPIFPMPSPKEVVPSCSLYRKIERADRGRLLSVRRLLRRDCDVIFLLPRTPATQFFAFQRVVRRLSFRTWHRQLNRFHHFPGLSGAASDGSNRWNGSFCKPPFRHEFRLSKQS